MKKRLVLKKKYFIILASLFFIGLFILIMALSYAFFTSTVASKDFVIYTGNLSVNYEKNTDVINLENAYPMTNEEGLLLTPHEFLVRNIGNITARYQVRLELDNTINDLISPEYIKLSYKIDDNDYSTPVLLSDLGSSLVFVSDIILSPTDSNNFGIKLWVDINASNNIQGKIFKAKVVVDSIQNVDAGYVFDTAPIIYLNKDNNGNQDINLKLNDTYTELGIKRVEDDKQVFSVNQVTKDYQYYNGTDLTTVSDINTSNIGVYYINYSITDRNNNIGRAVRIITVNPTDIIPTISLNGAATISIQQNSTFTDPGVNVVSGNNVVTLGEVKTNVLGTYIIKYIVIDGNGNMNSIARTVNVISKYTESLLNGADPVLSNNLVAVLLADDGTVTKADINNEWYNYGNKNWANAVVLKNQNISYSIGAVIPETNIESYFVWIPKYSYQLWDLGSYSSLTAAESKEHSIPIRFGLTNTSDSVNGECTTPGVAGSSGNCIVGDYMTHPAFISFDTNGLWVGKFETGYDGSTSTSTAEVNSSDSDKIIVKPNVYSWRTNRLGNMFDASYNYLRSDESHMMKNTEWGAATYLSHSEYGINTEITINNNNTYLTGCGGTTVSAPAVSICTNGFGAVTNYPQTTTGNISGIFDMSGGAWEYVMGYTTGSSTVGGYSVITTLHSDFFTNSIWDKYYDKYSSIGDTNYDNRILGDATGEMGPFASYESSWYGDWAYFADSSRPWFERGGSCFSVSYGGSFAFNRNGGGTEPSISFRVVLAP